VTSWRCSRYSWRSALRGSADPRLCNANVGRRGLPTMGAGSKAYNAPLHSRVPGSAWASGRWVPLWRSESALPASIWESTGLRRSGGLVTGIRSGCRNRGARRAGPARHLFPQKRIPHSTISIPGVWRPRVDTRYRGLCHDHGVPRRGGSRRLARSWPIRQRFVQ